MKQGVFYSVGVGPGDPKLMTFLAAETISGCPVIALPDSGAGDNAAQQIAAPWLEGKELLFCPMPMTRDRIKLLAAREESAAKVAAVLEQGKDVAFLTLGDSSIYATPMYLHRILKEKGYRTKMIPGIPSFCAVAASLDIPLCEGGEPLHVIPASYLDLDQALSLPGTKVLMKSGKSIAEVKKRIDENTMTAMAVERCGMEGEKRHITLDTLQDNASYFSVVVVKEKQTEGQA